MLLKIMVDAGPELSILIEHQMLLANLYSTLGGVAQGFEGVRTERKVGPHRGFWGAFSPRNIFQIRDSEILFPAFSAGHFFVNKYEGQCNN